MPKIKTRADAIKLSLNKWRDILTKLEQIDNEISSPCGFCLLAAANSCRECQPDAQKLCENEVTGLHGNEGIADTMNTIIDQTHNLIKKIKKLPDEYIKK